MDSLNGDRGLLCRVPPFGDLRVEGYLRLTAAFRSLLRPSSALSAKASTLRSCLLTSIHHLPASLTFMVMASGTRVSPAGRLSIVSDLVSYVLTPVLISFQILLVIPFLLGIPSDVFSLLFDFIMRFSRCKPCRNTTYIFI